MPDHVKQRPRHLTPDEKERILTQWEEAKTKPRPSSAQGDQGWPDPDIFELCDALNRLPGVCTLQSCAGHGKQRGDELYVHLSGHLMLWLDETTSRAFDVTAFELARRYDLMEQVSRVYTSWGEETVRLEFAGNERGLLAGSSALILDFFTRLTRDV